MAPRQKHAQGTTTAKTQGTAKAHDRASQQGHQRTGAPQQNVAI